MKTRILITLFALVAFTASPVVFTGCSTPPTQRSQAVTTLKVLGATVDASMKVAASLYHDGKITASQWQTVADAHAKFKSAYRVAVSAVQSNLDSIASPDLVALAGQLATVVQQFVPTTK